MLCWETEDDNLVEPAGPRGVFKALIFIYFFFFYIILSPVSSPGPATESSGSGLCFHFSYLRIAEQDSLLWKSSLIVIHSFLDALSNKCSNEWSSHPAVLMAYSR